MSGMDYVLVADIAVVSAVVAAVLWFASRDMK